jgi:hypothetical protein
MFLFKKIQFRAVLVVLFIISIVGYRFSKIVEKSKIKALQSESVAAKTIWDIKLPQDEFVGDQSQIGTWMVYVIHGESFARNLGQGTVSPVSSRPNMTGILQRDNWIGLSASGKKSFYIEIENGQAIIAQYNRNSNARGLLARFPNSCTDYKARQQLHDNFFAFEANCSSYKRAFIMNPESRRLTYASPKLPMNAQVIGFSP